jgi:RNA polymerase sigma-70 factor (ECF subfamily)
MPVPDPDKLLAALRELSARHARALGREEAADLAAEALARALRRPPPDGRFRPWLETIFRNLVTDHWRRAARDRRGAPGPAGEPSPEELALDRERRRVIRRSLGRLPRETRRALLLRYYLEVDSPAAARRQGISTATVRTRIHRGLARLREMVGRLRTLVVLPGWRLLPTMLHPTAALGLLWLAQQAPAPAVAPPPPASPAAVAKRPTAPRGAGPIHIDPPRPAPVPRVPPPPRSPSASRPAPPPVQRFEFADDQVTGELQAPDEDLISGAPPSPRHRSLIEIPDSMVPAVVKSIDDL